MRSDVPGDLLADEHQQSVLMSKVSVPLSDLLSPKTRQLSRRESQRIWTVLLLKKDGKDSRRVWLDVLLPWAWCYGVQHLEPTLSPSHRQRRLPKQEGCLRRLFLKNVTKKKWVQGGGEWHGWMWCRLGWGWGGSHMGTYKLQCVLGDGRGDRQFLWRTILISSSSQQDCQWRRRPPSQAPPQPQRRLSPCLSHYICWCVWRLSPSRLFDKCPDTSCHARVMMLFEVESATVWVSAELQVLKADSDSVCSNHGLWHHRYFCVTSCCFCFF